MHVTTPPPRLRILVVDDDPLIIKSLAITLEGDGHAVTTARSGQEGIDLFRTADGEQRALCRCDHRSGHAQHRWTQSRDRD